MTAMCLMEIDLVDMKAHLKTKLNLLTACTKLPVKSKLPKKLTFIDMQQINNRYFFLIQ